jgi:ribonuclease P protein component
MAAIYTYHKTEKLKSRKLLQELFARGKSFSVFPLKVFYMDLPDASNEAVQAGVGVSARNFRKAVDRNRIKRLLRECYRLNKLPLYTTVKQKNKSIAVFFLYIAKELPEYSLLEEKMKLALTKLQDNIG